MDNLLNDPDAQRLSDLEADWARLRGEIDEQTRTIRRAKLVRAQKSLQLGQVYIGIKASCQRLGRGFEEWIEQHPPDSLRTVEKLMQAVELGITPQQWVDAGGVQNAIARRQNRKPAAIAEQSTAEAEREERAWQLAALISKEDRDKAIELVDLDKYPEEFIEALKHLRRPHPRLQRPGAGIENLIVDCGAFSEYNSGVRVNLNKYCTFIEQHRDDLVDNTVFVALDLIRPLDTERSARVSFGNFQYMHERDLDVMPTVHVGESLDYLRRYLDEFGCNYIGLGGWLKRNRVRNEKFAERCWQILTRYSAIKVHGFAVSKPKMLHAYPWSSADGTVWMNDHIHRRGTDRLRAERIYKAARKFARLELEVQARRPAQPFHYYPVVGPADWEWPALFYAHHRSALVSYKNLRLPSALETLRRFIADPHSLRADESERKKWELLTEMADAYYQRWLRRRPGR
jgi:hypothetical protein